MRSWVGGHLGGLRRGAVVPTYPLALGAGRTRPEQRRLERCDLGSEGTGGGGRSGGGGGSGGWWGPVAVAVPAAELVARQEGALHKGHRQVGAGRPRRKGRRGRTRRRSGPIRGNPSWVNPGKERYLNFFLISIFF